MASVVNGFKGDGSDNDRIAAWLYDARNEYNCHECPYERESTHRKTPCLADSIIAGLHCM